MIETVWQLGQSIKRQQVLGIAYSRPGKDGPVHRQVEPVGLMFSDFYFYLIAFLLDEEGNPFTAHTTNPVPLILTNTHLELKEGGKLGDLAPTILQLLGLPIPKEMTGESLLK